MLQELNAVNVLDRLLLLENTDSVCKAILSNLLVDTLYISGNELLLVKYDLLADNERFQEWLADEEYLGEESSLYFYTLSY